MNHFDSLETRNPQAREAALMAALPAQIAHAQKNSAAFAEILKGVDASTVTSREALPHLLRAQAAGIVNLGALAAQKAGAGMGAYAASKAGVARLTEALAEELKDRGVRVNAVLPSILDTPANRSEMPDADTSRWVSPRALANVIAFLLSDDASAVTGACVPVAGRV